MLNEYRLVANDEDNIQLADNIIGKYDNHSLLIFLAIYQVGISTGNIEINNFIEADLELAQYLAITNIEQGNKKLTA